jgi:hypothetical protein
VSSAVTAGKITILVLDTLPFSVLLQLLPWIGASRRDIQTLFCISASAFTLVLTRRWGGFIGDGYQVFFFVDIPFPRVREALPIKSYRRKSGKLVVKRHNSKAGNLGELHNRERGFNSQRARFQGPEISKRLLEASHLNRNCKADESWLVRLL